MRTVTRDRQQVFLRRAIQLLYPLELKSTDDNETSVDESSESEVMSSGKEPTTVTNSETQGGEVADAPRRRSSRVACMLELNED